MFSLYFYVKRKFIVDLHILFCLDPTNILQNQLQLCIFFKETYYLIKISTSYQEALSFLGFEK